MSNPKQERGVKQEKSTENNDSSEKSHQQIVTRPPQQISVDNLQQQPLTNARIRPNWGFDRAIEIEKLSWETIGENKLIPVLFRNQEEFVSMRMVKVSVLGELLKVLPVEVYESIKISSYNATPSEAKMITCINDWHCNGFYGAKKFTEADLVIRLVDLKTFHDFLPFSFSVLNNGGKNVDAEFPHCWFVRIDADSLIPYSILETGEIQSVSGFPLVYLKICFMVHGVRKDLLSSSVLQIIILPDLQAYLPRGTTFTEECWPPPKQKSLLPMKGPVVQIEHDTWCQLERNETATATISSGVMNPRIENVPTKVQTSREIPQTVQARSPALARIKVKSCPVDETRLVQIPCPNLPHGSIDKLS